MYKNLEMMIEMKQAIDSATKDESVHITLTNIGNPVSESNPEITEENNSKNNDESKSVCTDESKGFGRDCKGND